jgi:hypothetical protein
MGHPTLRMLKDVSRLSCTARTTNTGHATAEVLGAHPLHAPTHVRL